MSKITVTTIAGATSGGDANKVKIESGDDFNVVSGKVGIGTVNAPSNKNTVTPTLNVLGSGVNGAAQITRHTSVGGGGALMHLAATRGTDVNSYTILQSGDGIGTVAFQAADGNEFVTAAQIVANVDGTPGDNDMPARLSFSVTEDGNSSPTERMRIHNGGVVSFSNGIELGSGLDATAANVLDDYEEGTWTPAWLNGSGQTYTYQYGTYVKIGRQVTVTCFISTSNMNGQTGDAAIGGLPFTASTGTFGSLPRAWGTVNGDNNWDTNLSTNNMVAQIAGGDNAIRPRYNSGLNTSDVQLQQIGGGNSYFGTTVTYETDS